MKETSSEQASMVGQSAGESHLAEVVALFLRLGFTAFDGPAAHIAMMRDEVVERRHWVSSERFVDLLGIVNLIPGPNSTEMAIYLGYLRAGWPGLLLGGVCFIGPAMIIVMALAWGYQAYGALPQLASLFYGIKPVVIAIIAQALWRLGRTVLKGNWKRIWPLVLGVLLLGLYLAGLNVLIVLFGGAILFAVGNGLERRRSKGSASTTGMLPLPFAKLAVTWPAVIAAVGAAAVPFSLATLFLTFLKIGAVLYGSGYVLLAFLRTDFVLRLQWLTDRQLLDAVSVGQFTPGPVFTTATFIGYLVGGWQGALLATLAIFLPSFFFVALVHPLAGWLRQSPLTATLLDGANLAAIVLMAGVLLQLAQSALVDGITIILALVSLAVLQRFKINSVWLIMAGALLGLAHYWMG